MAHGIRINGAVLAELRWLRCLSQEGLAHACRELEYGGVGLAREEVSRYECETQRPSPENLAAIRLALGLSNAEMRALVYTPVLDRMGMRAADPVLVRKVDQDQHHERQDQTHRREALERILGSLATAAGPWPVMPRLAPAAFTKVDAALVAGHADVGHALAPHFLTSDPRTLLPVAAGHADSVLALLDEPMVSQLRDRLEVIAVESHALAGLLAFMIGDRLGTRRYLAQAGRVAEDRGDPVLRAKALSMIAGYVYSPLPHAGRGDSRRAVRLLAEARVLAASADQHTNAWLATCYAMEAAELGPEFLDDCWLAVASASAALDRTTESAAGFFSPAGRYAGLDLFLEGVHGRICGLAGRFDEAERRYASELRCTSSPRQRIHALASLATVRVDAAAPEGACEALSLALDESATASYLKGSQFAAGVRRRFREDWIPLPCVRELDERRPLVT